MSSVLPWTGERFVPQVGGEIASEHLHRYAVATELAAGKMTVDIACGEGYGSNLLARVAKAVIGIDVDTVAVDHARRKYASDNLSFLVGTCDQIPLPNRSVDLVVSFETLEHHDRHLEMMAEVRRVLRPAGALLVSTPDKRVYSDRPGYANPYHVRELYLAEFELLLRVFFDQFVIYGQRVCWGSVIAPLDNRLHPFGWYQGGCDGIRRGSGLADARYLIGLAWNGVDPPPLPAGVFEPDAIPTEVDSQVVTLTQEVQQGGKLTGPNGTAPALPGGTTPAPAGRANAALEQTVREQTEVIERIAARLEAPTEGDPAVSLRAARDEVWYWRAVNRIRSAVETAIPAGATVAVVSRGGGRLLVLGDRRAMHFPQADDGSHTGHHPDDDAAAINHLEAVRNRGADYFLIPGYDLWLLTDYPEFGRHVKMHYRLVSDQPDTCMIFALR